MLAFFVFSLCLFCYSHLLCFHSPGTLDLKAAKENAHNGWVMSVCYDKDGEKIVSGGQDGTIKVWDSGVTAAQIAFAWPKLTPPAFLRSHTGSQD